ncbi:MFS transporter [Tuberibacillus sp. Marseille-P3662]|uniref:MFS transporter n=1 Tax=Tuberibacillus sp. Marseille-P3662 TaxID=1965358 RepID=UPI001594BF10|nr:MFS transporter [Tuberibacillus sp. Marseille-P3662]
MKEATIDKSHIFIIMFLICLVMSIQSPIFTPYAAGLGASSILIGIILSVSSMMNLVGNLLAGPFIDRLGKKMFITCPLFASGGLFIAHGLASDSASLLILRGLNGFALAFLMPAALALLSGYATSSRQQGKNMAVNGMLFTVASIVAPLIGGKMVVLIGYVNTYFFIGSAMILTGMYAISFLRERHIIVRNRNQKQMNMMSVLTTPNLLIVYLSGFAVMYIHGVLIYEIPYLTVEKGLSTFTTGQLFSYMSLGTLIVLSLFFINRFNPFKRMMVGLFGMSMSIYAMFSLSLPLPVLLFLIGLCFGLMMPALATAVTESVSKDIYGRAFGMMSAVYSLGVIISTFLTGVIRDVVSPYFIAFLIGMIILIIIGYIQLQLSQTTQNNLQ